MYSLFEGPKVKSYASCWNHLLRRCTYFWLLPLIHLWLRSIIIELVLVRNFLTFIVFFVIFPS